jgi:hypothetical protein
VPGSPTPSLSAQLDALAQLYADGALTDDVFASAKQRVLAG